MLARLGASPYALAFFAGLILASALNVGPAMTTPNTPPPSIWKVPALEPAPPLTEETLSRAEASLGVTLPEAFIALLREQNGGALRYTLPESCHTQFWGITNKVFSLTMDPWYEKFGEEDEWWLPRGPERLIPFDGDGHWYLCFDYRRRFRRRNPSITYVDLEMESERPIAKDFESFLQLLAYESQESVFGVVGVSVEEVAALLEGQLGVHCKPDDSWGPTSPTFKARLDGEFVEFITITPNAVPRAIASGKGREKRNRQLAKRYPGTALRFPRQPTAQTIVECSGSLAPSVLGVCKGAGMATIQLGADRYLGGFNG